MGCISLICLTRYDFSSLNCWSSVRVCGERGAYEGGCEGVWGEGHMRVGVRVCGERDI